MATHHHIRDLCLCITLLLTFIHGVSTCLKVTPLRDMSNVISSGNFGTIKNCGKYMWYF